MLYFWQEMIDGIKYACRFIYGFRGKALESTDREKELYYGERNSNRKQKQAV